MAGVEGHPPPLVVQLNLVKSPRDLVVYPGANVMDPIFKIKDDDDDIFVVLKKAVSWNSWFSRNMWPIYYIIYDLLLGNQI